MVYLINACMCVMLVVIYCNWYFFYYLLRQGEEHPKSIGQSTTDAFTATSEHQDRSEQDEGNVDENKEVHALPSSAND